jgi:beta-lactamase class D
MGEAVLGFLGVILGAAIAGGISLWQVQLVTKREREVQRMHRDQERMHRDQERMDRRDAFQQETLLALHDATSRMRHATVREYERRTALAKDEESWLPRDRVLMPDDWTDGAERLLWLQVRLLDQELRQLLERFRHESANVMNAGSKRVADDHIVESATLYVQANVRISSC